MRYSSAYGGESLRCDAATALERIEGMLAEHAPGAMPEQVVLRVKDAQTEALLRATRGQRAGPGSLHRHAELGGSVSPLAEAATARFGPGVRRCVAEGACGEVWVTEWDFDDASAISGVWDALQAFVLAHRDAAPVHACFDDRTDSAAAEPPVELQVSWDVHFPHPDGSVPFHREKTRNERVWEHSRIMAFLCARSSAIFDLTAPFSAVDMDFADWERALVSRLGHHLHDRHWRLLTIRPGDGQPGANWSQGRYRRKDWEPGGARESPPTAGPWSPVVEAVLAPRSPKDLAQKEQQLTTMPTLPVVSALVAGMGPLKGKPLERGRDALQRVIAAAPDKSELEPVVEHIFADPPNIAVSRKYGEAFRSAFGERWLSDLLLEELGKKKPSKAVLPFLEEASASYGRPDDQLPNERWWVLVQLLRLLRARAAPRYREQLAYQLSSVDHGRAWATWLLEAAQPPRRYTPGFDQDTWARRTFETFCAVEKPCHRVTDPAFAAYVDRLPPVGHDFDDLEDDTIWTLELTDSEVEDLLRREAASVGERADR